MNFPPKANSVLLLVQCLFIGMGYSLSRKMMRLMEQMWDSEMLALARPVPKCAGFVLSLGLWAFLIPLSWAAWAGLRAESYRSIPMTQAIDTKMSLILTLATVCVWSLAAIQAMDVALCSYTHNHLW
jgi:hypothetical protein